MALQTRHYVKPIDASIFDQEPVSLSPFHLRDYLYLTCPVHPWRIIKESISACDFPPGKLSSPGQLLHPDSHHLSDYTVE